MGGKGTYDFNYSLLFNIQLLCFIKSIWIDYFFNKIKTTNNLNENINRYLNNALIKSRVSYGILYIA